MKIVAIAAARLREILRYDPETGIWTWINCSKPRYNGKRADLPRDRNRPYRIVTINRVKYYAHRLAWLYMTGEWPSHDLDHKDTDKGNNIWTNLRLATDSQNNANKSPKPRLLPKGVDYSPQYPRPYRAQIKVNRRSIHLGLFASPQEAAEAYTTAAEKYFGEYARVK